MKTKEKPYATLIKKYKAGTVFDGEARIDALVKVLKNKETIIYLLEEREMSNGANTVTLKIEYK